MGCLHSRSGGKRSDEPGESSIEPSPTARNVKYSSDKTLNQLKTSSARSFRRMFADLEELSQESTIIASPLTPGESVFDWEVFLPGPASSPYESITLLLDLCFPETYPIDPPNISFRTPIFHPNVSSNGRICLNILKHGDWSPILTIHKVLISIQALLADPNPEDPLNVKAAEMCMHDRQGYNEVARRYATGRADHQRAKINERQEHDELQIDEGGRVVDEDELIQRLTGERGLRLR